MLNELQRIKASIPQKVNKQNDIVFIGSGISASFTIIKLLDQYKNTLQPLKISIIEKSKEFHTGIPYGYRSSDTTLLIKPLFQFLPPEELKQFTEWLILNKRWLLEDLLLNSGELTQKWYKENYDSIENDTWKKLYIPRSFFGKYISLTLEKKINSAKENGLLSVDYITNEVTTVDKSEDIYTIYLKDDSSPVVSKSVVLAIGSSPNRNLFNANDITLSKNNGFLIENPYEPSLESTFDQIKEFIINQKKEKVNVLIIGTNASGIEMVYKLNDHPYISSKIDQLFALSPQGRFPDPKTDPDPLITFSPSNLIDLAKKNVITANAIAEAARKDLDSAEKENISAIYTIPSISNAFSILLERLDYHEKKLFAAHVGNAIGKRQREAGSHYSDVIQALYSENRLINIQGKFYSIHSHDKSGLQFTYEYDKKIKPFEKSVDIIINCSGGCNIEEQQNENALINNLVKNNICKVNLSKRGFVVNDSLESSEEFYINGPLLGGNVIDQKPIWHVEHGGRIALLSQKLANILNKKLLLTATKIRDKEDLVRLY